MGCGIDFRNVIPEHMLQIKFVSTSWEIAFGGKSALV